MKNLGYYNGKTDLVENMTVPMNDRVCYFGDGVYDVTYARHYIPYCIEEHIDRFYSSAEQLKIKPPKSRAELLSLIKGLLRRVDSDEQMIYMQLTRGTGNRAHAFPNCSANLWIILTPAPVRDTYDTVTLHLVEDTRYLHCNIKTLNLIPNVMAEQEAVEAGCGSAVFHRGDRVTECAHANIHMMKNNTIITPPADNLILPGIARANIIKQASALGIPVEIRPFTVDEMMNADEVMMSSSGSFCLRVTAIDGRPVGGRGGATLRRLQDALVNDYINKTEE